METGRDVRLGITVLVDSWEGPGEWCIAVDVECAVVCVVSATNFLLSMAVRVAKRESMMRSWLSSRVLKVCIEAPIADWMLRWLV